MNEAHLRICASPEWAAFVESELLPWVLAEADLGDEVLEVGPGPGLTTDVLRRQVPRLTAVRSMSGWPVPWPGGWPAPVSPASRSRWRRTVSGSPPRHQGPCLPDD